MSIVILGGGIGGLSSMYYLLKYTNYKVILVEASNRLGGWIRSEKRKDGVIFEQGPRSLRLRGEAGLNTLNLIDDLNLSEHLEPTPYNHPTAKNRFIYVNGKLYALPISFFSLFRPTPPCTKSLVSAVLSERWKQFRQVQDDSIYNFVQRRFGKEFADYFISPLICGICGGDAKRISVKFLLQRQFEYEQKYRSVVRGYMYHFLAYRKPWYDWEPTPMSPTAKKAVKTEKWASYKFAEGMETLPHALSKANLDMGGTIVKNCTATSVNFIDKVLKTDKDDIKFDLMVSTVPAYSLASVVEEKHFALAKGLRHIPYVSIVTVNLQFFGKLLKQNGFGFLVPPQEKIPLLGVIFDSCITEDDQNTVLTVMMGGHAFNSFFQDNCTEKHLLDTALKYVAQILDIKESPHSYKINVLKDCIPQQIVGHSERVDTITNYIEKFELPLHLVGPAYKGTGINDVILSAKNTAIDIAKNNDKYCKYS